MNDIHSLLLVGQSLDPTLVDPISRSAREAGLHSAVPCDPRDASRWLDAHMPTAIAVDLRDTEIESTCSRVRGDARLAGVPIIALTDHLDDLVFPEVYGWGGDDVIAADRLESLVPRLRGIGKRGKGPARANGVAVIATNDPKSRMPLSRVLHNAGYEVRFATDTEQAAEVGRDARIVIADADLGPSGGLGAVSLARSLGARAPWVLAVPPRRIAEIQRDVRGLGSVGVVDAFAGPEAALFLANEMLHGPANDARSSHRLLYGTSVAFRLAGRETDSVGCSFNVSAGGLYIRTLAPPEAGESVWLELRPPRSMHRVRLEARVVWCRKFGPNDVAITPPGFGVEIIDGSGTDRRRYAEAYRAFAAELGHADHAS